MPAHGAEAADRNTPARRWALQRQAAPGIALPIGETQRERCPAAAHRDARNEPHLAKADLIKLDLNCTEAGAQGEPCLNGLGKVLAARRKAGPPTAAESKPESGKTWGC